MGSMAASRQRAAQTGQTLCLGAQWRWNVWEHSAVKMARPWPMPPKQTGHRLPTLVMPIPILVAAIPIVVAAMEKS